ncbi:MAG: zinc metalloprotease HtpX [Candidatus Bathyarchaeota archaeon]|nr:zinc metalloprotease HtpX [Candidatus Bathyarchaeota archaeon]
MNLLKLRLSMFGTLALIFGLSTGFLMVVLLVTGTFNIFTLPIFVVGFNLVQWLIAPYIIDGIYRVKEVARSEEANLYNTVERLSSRSGIKMPRVMIADIPIPNAFAYGSPLAGSRVAVTRGLLNKLEDEEVEAVVGHELGHLKHRDAQIMMLASLLPAMFYYIGYSLLYAQRGRDEERGSLLVAMGAGSVFLYWVLSFLVLGLSRLREYYADRHSAENVDDGARKLSEALAKIALSTGRMRLQRNASGFSSFKTLFISDPEKSRDDAVQMMKTGMVESDQRLVKEILSRGLTPAGRLLELISTHPSTVKRLKALQEL